MNDDINVYKNLRLVKPKIPFDPNIVKKKHKEMIENCNEETLNLIKCLNNPSLGPNATQKLYPKTYSKYKVSYHYY